MHMSDALLSPQVGAVMWGATAAAASYCARRVRTDADDVTVPLMGVAGAFVFAAQMLNFSIPGTGSSGHLGGGLLLAVLLGPHAAFLVMASVLAVQALFFADGGLLALGANIFNLGFFPAFIAYPLIYRRIVGGRTDARRLLVASTVAAVVALELGALGVVLETTASGVSELPFTAFLALMQPIHLAIGIVEGLATAGVLAFVSRVQPELLARGPAERGPQPVRLRRVVAGLAIGAVLTGAVLAWFASPDPDGLEWSIARVAGTPEVTSASDSGLHAELADVQERTSLLPDYGLPSADPEAAGDTSWPAVDPATSLAGVAGATVVLAAVTLTGLLLRRRRAQPRV
jgi:cobalt/nickel transport system permease protein